MVVIPIDRFRGILNLKEERDERTGKLERRSRYSNFHAVKMNVLKKAQAELFLLYQYGASDVWFDFQPGPRKGRGGQVSSVLIFVYTKKNPKKGAERPWQEGDAPLNPYEEHFVNEEPTTPQQRVHSNPFYSAEPVYKEKYLELLLHKYLPDDEAGYYLRMTLQEARKRKYNSMDAIMQMIQVIQDKKKQKKFQESTAAYRRNNLVNFVFRENLQREFGWHIDKMRRPDHLRRHKKV